jgi:transposase-like protein
MTGLKLPPPHTKRWTVGRKAELVEAVRAGRLTVEEACERYHISFDEFRAWERDYHRHGTPGLRITRVGIYRKT